MPKENNRLISLDAEEFQLWKDHPVTQVIIQFHQDIIQDTLERLTDHIRSEVLISDGEQHRAHEAIRLLEEFIDLEYQDLSDYYEETMNEDDPASVGKGVSQTG